MRISSNISGYASTFIWLLQSGMIVLLAGINPNHYTTIDSHYYLESAHNILLGRGYSIFQNKQYIWNSTFPPGYPLAIAMVSFLTKTNVLVASKLVNLIASAIWIICLKRRFGNHKATIIACILLIGSFLKLWVHSWSEPLFLVILFCWTYHFSQLDTGENLQKRRILYVFSLGLFLILTRYAGIFIIPITFIYALICLARKEKSKTFLYTALAFGWAIFFGGYLWVNFNMSDEWFGGGRLGTTIRVIENLNAFTRGLLNALLMIRNTDFSTIDILFCLGLMIQVSLLVLIIQQTIRNHLWQKKSVSIIFHFPIIAIAYLLFLFIIRIFSPFDEPGYRLLSPFSFLILNGILLSVHAEKITNPLKYLLIAFIIASWLNLVPQQGFKMKILTLSNLVK
ncbi:hypothetical protein [Dyadobacter sp. LHD-138]|uniref:hypothetical protein n=1 Tax=Dyadobacter sp. LHD-138 TaxID=3071413 RepID=UPI0027E16378|nr:hypothetical protein [Dyadobacter sp. LHD-138]MDQ6481254.1 hypothetical protein [Dyadobacter sp. LHD-138]